MKRTTKTIALLLAFIPVFFVGWGAGHYTSDAEWQANYRACKEYQAVEQKMFPDRQPDITDFMCETELL